MKKILYLCFCICFPILLFAQNENRNDAVFNIENSNVIINPDNSLLLTFKLIIPSTTKLSTNEALKITPVLYPNISSSNNIALPAIEISGRSRYIINARYKNHSENLYANIRRENRTNQTIDYAIQLPLEAGIKKGKIDIMTEILGCADCKKYENESLLMPIKTEEYIMQPYIAFIMPPKEEVKVRALKGSAYLDFPVNKTVIYPDFKQNEKELLKIRQSIEIVKNDNNTSITDIEIVGYASPEGSYQNNARLAQGRAEALKSYLLDIYQLNQNLIKVSSVPEDWAGLREYVVNNDINYKNEILEIIDSNLSEDAKDAKIKKIGNGSVYNFLLSNVYPALRHSDYTINYTVKDFNLEEAKNALKNSPHLLSMQELYIISQDYPKGSTEFNEVFDIAVRLFPNDPIANSNAAAMSIMNGNIDQSQKYINKSVPTDASTINNLGVIEMLNNNLDAAEKLFIEAQSKGSSEAEKNLQEIEKKRNDLTF